MINKICTLTFALLFSHASQAAMIDIAGDPFTLEAGTGPLELSALITDNPRNISNFNYIWEIEGNQVSAEVTPALSWVDIVTATGGGELGSYEIRLSVFGFYTTCVFGSCFPNIDEGFDTASLAITAPSAIPVPAAVWLFGTALIGMVGFSKRKSKVAV
jgi:hypothetical protein